MTFVTKRASEHGVSEKRGSHSLSRSSSLPDADRVLHFFILDLDPTLL